MTALTSLKSLDDCEEITDNGLKHLKEALQKLPSLQKISLDFERYTIPDKEINFFLDVKELKMLELNI